MSWNNRDKISFEQLNPELQLIINNKVDVDNYRDFTSEFNTHRLDRNIHLTSETKRQYDYAYSRVINTLDMGLADTIQAIKDITVSYPNHVSDFTTHWTAVERNAYNTFVINTNNALTDIQSQINQILDKTDARYITSSKFNEIETNLNDHVISASIHVSESDRLRWDSIESAVELYADNLIYNHTQVEKGHITDAERDTWNYHVNNDSIHVTTEEKGDYSNHLKNSSIHVTITDKNDWNNLLYVADAHTTAIRNLNSEIGVLTTNINNMRLQINQILSRI